MKLNTIYFDQELQGPVYFASNYRLIFQNYVLRFISLMQGHIWLESEGLGMGCTATFVVKLGVGNNSSNGSAQQALSRSNLGVVELSGDGVVSSKPRYQRSV